MTVTHIFVVANAIFVLLCFPFVGPVLFGRVLFVPRIFIGTQNAVLGFELCVTVFLLQLWW